LSSSYSSDLARTSNGTLNISTILDDIQFDIIDKTKNTKSKKTKHFQSGMIQGEPL
jgi:hypothetical protein